MLDAEFASESSWPRLGQFPNQDMLACDLFHNDVATSSEIMRSSSPMSLREEGVFTIAESNDMIDEDSTSHCHEIAEDEVMDYSDGALQVEELEDEVWFGVSDQATGHESVQDSVVAQIESIFEAMADNILAERKELSITLMEHRHADSGDKRVTASTKRSHSSTFCFPGKSAEEAWRFCQFHLANRH